MTPPVLNPRTYVSPSGEFLLHVDPSDLYGRGDAIYRVSKNGTVVWTGRKPFTLYDGGITDAGVFAGYAYIYGIEGFPEVRTNDVPGEFHVVAVKPNGEMILQDVVKRTSSRFLHCAPNPLAHGVMVDGPGNRLVVVINDEDVNRRQQRWWTYELSSGKSLGKSNRGPNVPATSIPTPPQPQPLKVASLPVRPFKQLGSFSLTEVKESSGRPAIRDIISFDVDDQERIGFIRREARNDYAFVLVGSEGKILRETTLTFPARLVTNSGPATLWLEGEQWLIVLSQVGVDGKASAWRFNASTGKTTAIPNFQPPSISKVARLPDGGFVALVTKRHQYSMEDALVAFDKAGKALWEVEQDYARDHALFSPEDLAVTTDRHIAVVDNIQNRVQFFDLNGKFVRALGLTELWGRNPNYPSGIAADGNGGIVIEDFNGNPPLVRMNRTGKVVAQFVPKHSDGRSIDLVGGMRIAPSGRMWVSDGECFARLRGDGVSESVVGGAPAAESLGKIAAATVDQRGRVYAADERSAAVHVFDHTGKRVLMCKPGLTDFKSNLGSAQVAVEPDGTIYLNDHLWSRAFVQFSSNGRRAGVKRLAVDDISQEWHPLPNGNQLLVIGYHDAFVLNREDQVVRTIQRRPDENWLQRPERASVGSDGSFAIITGGGYWSRQPWLVNLYNAAGEPVRMLALPAACMDFCFTYTGKHLVTRTDAEVCVFSASGEPVARFSPDWADFKSERTQCFATFQGRELWLVSLDRKSVCRFELP